MKKKIKNRIFYYVVLGLFLVGVSILVWPGAPKKTLTNLSEIKTVQIAGQDVAVELALTGEQKMQGLSGRESLKEKEGMLFVFDIVGKHTFWMKDMKFPIDIIWINGDPDNPQVVYIEKNATPESFPKIFGGIADSQYVLEVNAGFSEKNNLKVGDRVKFLP